jgi:translocation and assembly module TamB
LQARVRGRLGPEWTGTADLELARGEVLGIEVTQWRVPLRFSFAPSEGRGQIEVHETSAQAGRGRANGKLVLGWDYTTRAHGQLRFSRVDLQTMLRQTVGQTQVGAGTMAGRFDFSGRDMRSLNELDGKLEASFEQSQAFTMPVLKDVSRYVGAGPSTTFQKGDLRARLDSGLFRIQRLALEGANLQVFMEGTVSLAGRLDLDALATTGTFGPDPRLRLVGLKIPFAGPVPLVVVQEATTLLSNRVIHLRVTGTIRSPSIRVLPLPTLTQEAARYFLQRQVGPLPFNP